MTSAIRDPSLPEITKLEAGCQQHITHRQTHSWFCGILTSNRIKGTFWSLIFQSGRSLFDLINLVIFRSCIFSRPNRDQNVTRSICRDETTLRLTNVIRDVRIKLFTRVLSRAFYRVLKSTCTGKEITPISTRPCRSDFYPRPSPSSFLYPHPSLRHHSSPQNISFHLIHSRKIVYLLIKKSPTTDAGVLICAIIVMKHAPKVLHVKNRCWIHLLVQMHLESQVQLYIPAGIP